MSENEIISFTDLYNKLREAGIPEADAKDYIKFREAQEPDKPTVRLIETVGSHSVYLKTPKSNSIEVPPKTKMRVEGDWVLAYIEAGLVQEVNFRGGDTNVAEETKRVGEIHEDRPDSSTLTEVVQESGKSEKKDEGETDGEPQPTQPSELTVEETQTEQVVVSETETGEAPVIRNEEDLEEHLKQAQKKLDDKMSGGE